MPLQRLQLKPGVNRDQTNYANTGGWYACDKIRFRSGFPQKIGGWIKSVPTALLGVCRELFNWVTFNTEEYLALGTNKKVYLESGAILYDITPLRESFATPDTDNSIATGFTGTGSIAADTLTITVVTRGSLKVGDVISGAGITVGTTITALGTGAGLTGTYLVSPSQTALATTVSVVASNTLTVTLVAFGSETGDFVTISGASAVGGIAAGGINGNFELTKLTANIFTVTSSATSTSSATGGGTAIDMDFEISVGYEVAVFGYGWGTGTWGRNAWGVGCDPIDRIYLPQRDWFFDNFDSDLVMNIRNGPIYYWTASTGPTVRAELMSGMAGASFVPHTSTQILMSQGSKHLLSLGANPYDPLDPNTDFDPLLIRWTTQDNPLNWAPLSTNSAGDYRLPRGSRIICGTATRQEVIVWTDANMYSLQYLGTTDVFNLQEMSNNTSIISPRASATANNTVFWMGIDKFYVYTGQVATLPCTLRNHVFNNLNFAQSDQIIAGTNEGYNEIWWFYPTAESTTNNAYVVYNYFEQIWYYGTMERTAWLDSSLRFNPIGVGNNYIYAHESGCDDDTLPLESYIQSSDIDISDGENYILVRRIIPDISFGGSTTDYPTAYFTLKPRTFSGSAYISEDPELITETQSEPVELYTEQLFTRARARQVGIKVSSTALGVQWQLGIPRVDGRPDGKK